MRVLTLRELNRATLARQLLLDRKQLSPSVAVERVAGLQAQWAPAPYIGLWTRTESFRREALEKALLARRIVRAVLMRFPVQHGEAHAHAEGSHAAPDAVVEGEIEPVARMGEQRERKRAAHDQ